MTPGRGGPYSCVVTRDFAVIVTRDAEEWYVADVPQLPGCHSQARTLADLQDRVREVIDLCLEDGDDVLGADVLGDDDLLRLL